MGIFTKFLRRKPDPHAELLQELDELSLKYEEHSNAPELELEPAWARGFDFESFHATQQQRLATMADEREKIREDWALNSDVALAENELDLLRGLANEATIDPEVAEMLEERLDGSIPLFSKLTNRSPNKPRIAGTARNAQGIVRASDDDANEELERQINVRGTRAGMSM